MKGKYKMRKPEINIFNNMGISDDYIEFGQDYKTGLWTFKNIKINTKNVESDLQVEGRVETIITLVTKLLVKKNKGLLGLEAKTKHETKSKD